MLGPKDITHDEWAQSWLGALTLSKEIPDSVWPERRLYREFIKACLIALAAFGEKNKADMIFKEKQKLRIHSEKRFVNIQHGQVLVNQNRKLGLKVPPLPP